MELHYAAEDVNGQFILARRLSGLHADTISKRPTVPENKGMTKAGNRHVRWMTTELAWSWLRFQPDSALSVSFWER